MLTQDLSSVNSRFGISLLMYLKRNITPFVKELLDDFKIVSINGPRQSGKTTLAKQIAKQLGFEYYTFDDETVKSTAKNNPSNFINKLSKTSCVIDEIQMVPEVISALKVSVDKVNKAGMFLLTGSADLFKMSSIKESLAGRMVSVNLYPLSCFELSGNSDNLIDMLFDNSIIDVQCKAIEYENIIEQILKGGYPYIQNKTQRSRDRWFETYIEARIQKDLSLIKKITSQNHSQINKLLNILAANTSGILKYSALSKHLSIKDVTVKSDIEILEALFLIKRVNPYFTNRGKREIKAPKIHFIDTGLVAHLLDLDVHNLIISQKEILGNLVENFVYTELLKHTTYAKKSTKIYHYRDANFEVDLVLEQKNGNIIAIEVKSSSTIKPEHFKGLSKLAHNAGDKFLYGYLFYGGDKILPFEQDGIVFWAIPLSSLF
jgi:predicted AAA+ superfamily ATPase